MIIISLCYIPVCHFFENDRLNYAGSQIAINFKIGFHLSTSTMFKNNKSDTKMTNKIGDNAIRNRNINYQFDKT